MAPPTIRRVAELAGVSTATVSRTLAHPDKVTEATREKVLDAVRQTGFVPNRQAVDFRRQATNNVVLLVRDITNPFYLDIYRGIEELAFANGYSVLMGDARYDDARVARYIDMVRNRQADGLILMTGWIPDSIPEAGLPQTVIALEVIEGSALPAVAIDNRKAAQLATEHLLSLGHRRIAHITGPMQLVMSSERHKGYLDALACAGIVADPALTFVGDFHFGSGQAAIRQFCGGDTPFTGVFCSSDETAVGAINELRGLGKSVPGDISIVGFDDMDYALSSDPPLTSVRQPRREIGRQAMQMLVDLLAGRQLASRSVEAGVELVVRASTAPPKPSRPKDLSKTESTEP
jgi:LacI family repressor for deo operon, udp, cdd, tsx, nupC, and nupG